LAREPHRPDVLKAVGHRVPIRRTIDNGLPLKHIAGYHVNSPVLRSTTKEHRLMVNAIVLIQTKHGQINDVAEKLADIPEMSDVFSVGGSFDIIAIIRARDNEEISELVTQKMVNIEGIERTETMIAFKAYSRHDLEAVFSIGLDN
jgi:DNA-binding Lrp family transcriptional regulator